LPLEVLEEMTEVKPLEVKKYLEAMEKEGVGGSGIRPR
jgi:hypothetical protein